MTIATGSIKKWVGRGACTADSSEFEMVGRKSTRLYHSAQATFVPSGLPSPVHASHPGPAAKSPLLL